METIDGIAFSTIVEMSDVTELFAVVSCALDTTLLDDVDVVDEPFPLSALLVR